ncbi:MAG: hypothetical protein SGCHY_000002 [Lobulomycetales sp.]
MEAPEEQLRILRMARDIDSLVSLIPAQHYSASSLEVPEWQYKSKYMKNSAKTDTAVAAHKKKAKLAKLDPDAAPESADKEAKEDDENSGGTGKLLGAGPAASMQELRERLAARITQLRSQSGRRQDAPKSRMDVLKGKKREKAAKKAKSDASVVPTAAQVPADALPKGKKRKGGELADEQTPKESYSTAGIQFGVLEFGGKDAGPKKKKSKKGPAIGDTAAQLKKLEAKKERLDRMKPEVAEAIKEKDMWSSLISRAQGEKVLDDPALLAKTIKRKEKEKKKKKDAWEDRVTSVKQGQQDRQYKRTKNMKQRGDAIKKDREDRRKKKAQKKGR